MLMPQLDIAPAAARRPFESIPTSCAANAARPRMLVAHRDPAYLASVCGHFHRLGWDVRRASGGAEARWLVFVHEPAVVILQTGLPDQSGWLSCCKIRRDGRCEKVILVSSTPEHAAAGFARFVGAAAIVPQQAGIPALVDAVYEGELAGIC